MAWTVGGREVDDCEQTFMEQEMWKDIWANLQKFEANLDLHFPTHKGSILPGHLEADALAKNTCLATDQSVDIAD